MNKGVSKRHMASNRSASFIIIKYFNLKNILRHFFGALETRSHSFYFGKKSAGGVS